MADARGIKLDKTTQKKAKPKKNHIIAIAINKYSNGQASLTYPVEECERLIKLLTERYNFDPRNIRRLYNEKATNELLRDELYDLPDKLGPEDNLVLLFAGHGLYDERRNEGYWVPVDAPKLESYKEAEDVLFPFHRIVRYLNHSQAHHIVFIIDSCFSGKFGQVTMRVPEPVSQRDLTPEEIPSRWVITSGRNELVADKSPFAQAIWETLNNNYRERILLQTLYSKIRQKMEAETTQTAYCTEIVAGEARGGEFAFELRQGQATANDSIGPQMDNQRLRRRLRQGSRAYLDYLKKGRLAKLQFEKILLPDAQLELLDMTVRLEDASIPLWQAMHQLWHKDIPHTLIVGEGGMGKTVSCVRLWAELLEASELAPVPIFLPLNEYNATAKSERESKDYLFQFIAREYLDDTLLTPELKDTLKSFFKERKNQPTALLFLDGFNEITIEKSALMIELAEFVRRAKGVQLAVTSRYEMRTFAWTQDFDRLDLLDLTPSQIESYLARHNQFPPENAPLRQLLGNPMMLTLYTGTSQLAVRLASNQRTHFKPKVNSKGELLHNFIEGQLAKYLLDNATNTNRDKEFIWQSFLLRHILPYLAYQMMEKGQFFIYTRKLLDPAFNFKRIINEAYAYFSSFDFTDLYPLYEGHRAELGFGIVDTDYDALEARSGRIRLHVNQKLFLLSEEGDTIGFLHQNFRDYFAARHVQHIMELYLMKNKRVPPESKEFPPPLRKKPLNYYARQFLGQLEGEHNNKPIYLPEKKSWSTDHFNHNNLISLLLGQCRGIFNEKQLGYTIWNILTIWKEHRGELSGADLHQLNFKGFPFNGVLISRPGITTCISGGALWQENFFLMGHSGSVLDLAYSPNGRHFITGSDDGTARVWDDKSGQCLLTLYNSIIHPWPEKFMSVSYRADGKHILTGSSDKTAKVWDARSGRCLLTLEGHNGTVMTVTYSPNGRQILTGSSDRTVKIWDAHSGQCLLTLKGHNSGAVTYSPNGRQILTGSSDKTVKIWDAHSGRCLMTLEGHRLVNSVAYSPNGKQIFIGSYDRTAKIWDVHSGQCLMALEGHRLRVNSVAYSPDGRHIVTGSPDGTAKIWNIHSGQCLATLLVCHSFSGFKDEQGVNSVAYSPDGRKILTGSYDKTTKVWDAQNGQCLLALKGHGKSGIVFYSPNGEHIIIRSSDTAAKIWDVQSGRCILTITDHFDGIGNCIAYSPDGKRILTGSSNGIAKIWDVQSGRCLLTIGVKSGTVEVISTAYCPEGQRVITGFSDNTAKVWDAQSGQCLLTLNGHLKGDTWPGIISTSYSPDGSHIITGSSDHTAKIWDAQNGKCLLTLKGHRKRDHWSAGVSTAYSPDGSRIVTISSDHKAKVWDAQNGQCLLTIMCQSSSRYFGGRFDVAYSPDGKRIVTCALDGTTVWDAQSGQKLLTLDDHSDQVHYASYSPNGKYIVSSSPNHTIKIWDAQSGQCLITFPNIPGLFIQGCDFQDMHPNSELSEETVAMLRQYGGIFNDEDEKRWNQLMAKHFGVKSL